VLLLVLLLSRRFYRPLIADLPGPRKRVSRAALRSGEPAPDRRARIFPLASREVCQTLQNSSDRDVLHTKVEM